MLHWLWVLIVGGIIGLVAGFITRKDGSMNWLWNILAGLVGSSLGQAIFGSWGWHVAGMAVIPSILGAIIVVLVVSWLLSVFNSKHA